MLVTPSPQYILIYNDISCSSVSGQERNEEGANFLLGSSTLPRSEIDILVSKLLGFETFAKSLRVSVSVSENLVSEKKSRFRFRKNLVSEKSLGFGKFGLGKEKIQITRTVLVMMSQLWDLVPIGIKALKWSHVSPNSARKSQISSLLQDTKLSPIYL